jgi:hypothetical protein
MKDLAYCLGLIFVLGLLLVMVSGHLSEGFESGLQRCDVDKPCDGHLKCINGFCAKTEPVDRVEVSEVPLLPSGSPAPYF